MTLAVAVVALYALAGLGSAALVWRARQRSLPDVPLPRISVVVAARNEEKVISGCLAALAAQDYPADGIDFVIVDDASNDATLAIARSVTATDDRFTVTQVETQEELSGKAAALHHGIGVTSSEIILLTDADCRPPASWARCMARAMAAPNVGVLGSITRVERRGLFGRLQSIDWTLLKSVAAGWSLSGRPLTAMGNSMAVRREAYDFVGGFPSVARSVTEDYALFERIGSSSPFTAQLLPHSSLENRTLPEPDLMSFFRQRRRWARGAIATSPLATAFYVVIYGAHLLPLLLVPTAAAAATYLIAAKVLTDVVVLSAGSERGMLAENLVLLPLYELFLHAYVLFLPVSLAVAPDITWKQRRYHSSGGSAR
ncbi:MAG: glycosyltransferase [Bacteroidota bacterium]